MAYKYIIRFLSCYAITKHFYESIKFSLFLNFKKIYKLKLRDKFTYLRNNKIDEIVFYNTFFQKYHKPFCNLGLNPIIIDLGANIGLTMISYKLDYPNAKIIGIEMDKENYELCRKNIIQYDNMYILNNAIWTQNIELSYDGIDTQSFKIIHKNTLNQYQKVQGITMEKVLESFNLESVDFLKIDIEGTEKELFAKEVNNNWLFKVKYIYVELHDHLLDSQYKYQVINHLKNYNFKIFNDGNHFNAIFAINNDFEL